MKATAQLKEEHQAVRLMLQILAEVANRLRSKKEVNPQHLDQLVKFMKVFVDGCHHAKEEGLLFPALEENGVPNEGGPIGMMLWEHEEERGHVRALTEGIQEYGEGNLSTGQKIVMNIDNLTALLSEHIDKEDNILYPIADMHLSKKQQNNLYELFEKVEKEKVGQGQHQQFHQMLNDLKKIYLK